MDVLGFFSCARIEDREEFVENPIPSYQAIGFKPSCSLIGNALQIASFSNLCEIPEGHVNEGICRGCGIDKDDRNVLLCDKCDSGYHTYCLSPPLMRIPAGNCYCPLCTPSQPMEDDTTQIPQLVSKGMKKAGHGEFIHIFIEDLGDLNTTMGGKDYWNSAQRSSSSNGDCASWGNGSQEAYFNPNGGLIPTVSHGTEGLVIHDGRRTHLTDRCGVTAAGSRNPFAGHNEFFGTDGKDLVANDPELHSISSKISVQKNTISCLESKLLMVSPRKELLRKDYAGRLSTE
ncbi:Methyl-CpG-binding domain-containing protein 9 [Linum grandiflorum]